MIIREDYPIYVNPDFDEIKQIAERGWDTLRIMASDEYFIIGSGYGNTHSSLVVFAKNLLKKREMFHLLAYIMFHEGGRCYFNMDGKTDQKDDESMPASKALGYFCKWQQETIRDIIRESDLVL